MEATKIIRAFGILNRTFISYISAALSNWDISYSDSIFLINIGDWEGTSQEELSEALAIDKAAVARSVKTMEKLGYVKTERSLTDKRAKVLYLTSSGNVLYQNIQSLNAHWLHHVLGDINTHDMDAFIRTIDHISIKAKTYNK